MAKTFRNALLEYVESTGTPLKVIAERSGVSYEQLKKVQQRANASTNVDDARKIANSLGLTLDEFLGDHTIEARIHVVELYSSLSPTERRILRAAAAASDDPDRRQE